MYVTCTTFLSLLVDELWCTLFALGVFDWKSENAEINVGTVGNKGPNKLGTHKSRVVGVATLVMKMLP